LTIDRYHYSTSIVKMFGHKTILADCEGMAA
jgi:hypothetical protein